MNLLRISVVSYLNSRPFILGLNNSEYIRKHAIITTDNPAECARKVKSGEADMGLIPVAILPDLGEYHIYSDYCIGAKGKVRSVFLFSEVPVQEVKEIVADPQSRTSVALTKVLAKFFWKIEPEFKTTNDDNYLTAVRDHTAAVMIGDRTFNVQNNFKYPVDLAEQWMDHTGLPFVFACWAGKMPIDPEFIKHFNQALEYGVEHRDEVIAAEKDNYNGFDVKDYLKNNITYVLDSSKRKGMELFLSLLQKLPK
jgi:chorismate dehydratase